MSDVVPRPDHGPAPAPDPLAVLIRTLRAAGLDPAEVDLADALWLARFTRPLPAPPRGPQPGGTGPSGPPHPPSGSGEGTGHPVSEPEEGTVDAVPADPRPRTEDAVALYAARGGRADEAGDGQPSRELLRVVVPEARALPDPLELQRALRPLRRYRRAARPLGRVLDETRTAQDSARVGGVLTPVFQPAPRGETTVQLLMDGSPAMRVWELLLRELSVLFAQLGAFRNVQVRYLHRSPDGVPAVSGHWDPDAASLGSTSQLGDPTGRRLTVILSDCTGPLWREGQAHRLVYRLIRHAPVAIMQPLPQRLWARTRLPVSHGALRGGVPSPGGSAAQLRFTAKGSSTPRGVARRADGAMPVPVLPPAAGPLGAWARLLSGADSGPVAAAVGWVRPDQPPAARSRTPSVVSSAALVGRFRSSASPGASQLALYLAAAPLFLPVMQLVQRTMLPDSGPTELSEVLLSGLLRRREAEPGGDGLWYVFAEGVHEELLGALGRDEALLVLKHCSGYIEQHFGRGGPNFPAFAVAQLTGGRPGSVGAAVPNGALAQFGDPSDLCVPQPFAEVAAKVLWRFLPETPLPDGDPTEVGEHTRASVERARALAARFTADGMMQHLLDAVQLLRRASEQRWALGQGTDPELGSELATQLLRLWRLQGDAELLREAQAVAETAASHLGSVRARTVLARVLHAAAGQRRSAGDSHTALELWRRADREFAAVCATPRMERTAALAVTLERIDVLVAQWRLGGDAGLLHESVGTLEAVADAWPAGEPWPSALSLAHGRALLRLAGAADGERTRLYAAQAADSLERGYAALRGESVSADARVQALLDWVDALLPLEDRLPRAGQLVEQARELVEDGRLRAACLVRSGRLCVRRYHLSGSPTELEAAARWFAEASRLLPRDRAEYGDLVAEWGAALLDRARFEDGGAFVSQAVQVLRNCRMETPLESPALPARLSMLGHALIARYREVGELVDLREAEYLFSLAARSADEPLARARAWFEVGQARWRTYQHAQRVERLEHAADAYRKAAEAARAAETQGADATRLAGDAHHQRGEALEAAGRPRAAREAYRVALSQWRRLPEEERRRERTMARLRALEDSV